jgi:quercetin dioxygenase-like cupin family protein
MGDVKIEDLKLVVVSEGVDGEPEFSEPGNPAVVDFGFAYGLWNWEVQGGHRSDNLGAVPATVAMGTPGGSTFGVMVVRAHGGAEGAPEQEDTSVDGIDDDPHEMHATQTIDYDIVVSGKVDLHLPGGKVRTLEAGTSIVVTGVKHSWKNPYDVDGVVVVVTVGLDA